mgnify:CR=1 FL=1
MQSFTFSIPQNIIFGKGSIKQLPSIAEKLGGKHAYIISGPVLEKMGLVKQCEDSLKEAGFQVDSFTETEGNPSVTTVEKAEQGFRSSKADFIIALGGGSPMDVAKAVAVVAKYGGSITEYEGADKVPGPVVPLIAIPTTAGTGSEVTAFSVITDHSRNYKLTVFSYELIPAYAVLDAELIMTAPSSVAAACGMDALIHAIEAYISTAASPFSEAMSEKAMELIGANVKRYVANRKDEKAAEAMLAGSLFAGIAFSWARLGNVHAMSHPVSAYFDVPHGVANAILLPMIMDYNALADNGKYYKIYQYISSAPVSRQEFTPELLVKELRECNALLGIPAGLSEVGVTEDKISAMAEDAMKSGNVAVNPRSTQKKDIEALYRAAM